MCLHLSSCTTWPAAECSWTVSRGVRGPVLLHRQWRGPRASCRASVWAVLASRGVVVCRAARGPTAGKSQSPSRSGLTATSSTPSTLTPGPTLPSYNCASVPAKRAGSWSVWEIRAADSSPFWRLVNIFLLVFTRKIYLESY